MTSHEVTDTGVQSTTPAWWDPTDERAYLTYVTDTVKHVAGEAGYGGSILDYGRLDAVWGSSVSGAVDGWAQADINEFHNVYLPQTYGSISAFNSANKTSYTSFSQVPAAKPGQDPQQPVAVYLDESLAYGNASGPNLGAPENNIAAVWDGYQGGFAVVTSEEVKTGIVKLSQYKAILPINGVDANLTAYKNSGGNLLTAGSQLSRYAPAYATLANSGIVQIVPVVSTAKTSAQLTLADINSATAYQNTITVDPAGLGLASGSYHLVDASGSVAEAKLLTTT